MTIDDLAVDMFAELADVSTLVQSAIRGHSTDADAVDAIAARIGVPGRIHPPGGQFPRIRAMTIPPPPAGACVVCGCTDERACQPDSCSWATQAPPVCTACVGFLLNIQSLRRRRAVGRLFGVPQILLMLGRRRRRST